MEDATVIYPFFPAGVQRIIATGSTSYVGIINQDTVLKYPHEQHGQHGLKVEATILGVLGSHPRIIKLKGWDKEGLRLEYAHNGRLDEHLEKFAGSTLLQDRFRWTRQAAEAVAYVHTKGVLHCDIRLGNLLLDKNFDIKLCDFQGIYQTADGNILDGFAGESVKYSLPRQNPLHADRKTDLFALGTAIYHIMQGHEPYPELHNVRDKDKIINLYRAGQFPEDLSVEFCGDVVRTCWNLGYDSADQICDALKELEAVIE
ncbi:kinase-like protein [Zopfia rhizophila CBS 207.26]|uniref:EKC/KEOPS complex subunit BUD32 n=1 Tax=Zopfia rhizophila CBS 207.26 TaxID=1314779 RepID=A0A6A6EFV5_9PEZI|nr:kinase-like protein [Zopfia rhizophila CBS 207.26]